MITVNQNNGLLGGIFLIGSGLYLFFRGFKLLKIEREVSGLPNSKIRSMAMGRVELSGRVVAVPQLVDPIYSQSCAYFRVTVQEERRSGKDTRWETVYETDSSDTPFILTDDTGQAMVLPKGADLQRPATVNCTRGNFWGGSPDPSVEQFSSQFRHFSNTLRIEAHILRDQDPLFVVGTANPQLQPRESLLVTDREAAEALKSNQTLMKSLDTNKDGIVDAEEWQKGVQAMKDVLEKKKMDQAIVNPQKESLSPTINVINKSPDGLLILASSENYLVSHYRLMALLFTLGGPAMVVLGVYWLSQMK